MSTADNSYEGRTQRLRSRTLAAFRANNPTAPEAGRYIFDESTRVVRRMGQMRVTVQPAEGETYTIPCCSCDAPIISGFTPGNFILTEPNFTFNVTWNPVPDTTASFIVLPACDGQIIASQSYIITGPGSATVTADVLGNLCDATVTTITMTLTSSCGSATASGPAGVCFLAGARVTLADGTEKLIEDVLVGDSVLGAFGETNTVLALHRPLLGENRMCSINGDHHTSNHHPHIGAGKQFYSNDIVWLQKATYGQEHNVINAAGEVESRMLHGLRSDRMIPMAVGVELKTVSGSRPVESLDVYNMAPETQLYNLVIGGSHTYFVDGYAVTGWPREDDFDYDAWAPRI